MNLCPHCGGSLPGLSGLVEPGEVRFGAAHSRAHTHQAAHPPEGAQPEPAAFDREQYVREWAEYWRKRALAAESINVAAQGGDTPATRNPRQGSPAAATPTDAAVAAWKWGYEYLQSRMESIDRHGWAHDCDEEIQSRIAAALPTQPNAQEPT